MDKNRVSIVTSINKRFFESEYQTLVQDMREKYPDVPFYIYHENSYEEKNFGQSIDLSLLERENVHLIDLHTCWDEEWLEDFVDGPDSPFAPMEGVATTHSNYWKRHSKFWFRKVAAEYHCAFNECETPIMIWMDSDTRFKKDMDNKIMDFIYNYDICYIARTLKMQGWTVDQVRTESGFVTYDITNPWVRDVLQQVMNLYKDRTIFKSWRWDDCEALDTVLKTDISDSLKLGYFNNPHSGKTENVSSFNIYGYIGHYLKMRQVRKAEPKRIKHGNS